MGAAGRAKVPHPHECPAPASGCTGIPVGDLGDLWRCPGCKALWRIGRACTYCDTWGARPHPGLHDAGAMWLPATLWQRVMARLFQPVGDR